jgi:general secretion pathway protein E
MGKNETEMLIALDTLAGARAAAVSSRRRLVDVLEEQLAVEADAFVDRLGATLRLPVIRMEELRRTVPAFELLPFNECSNRACALVRAEEGGMLLVTDDPFSTELVSWAEERLASTPFAWRLAHRGDLVAFLASHEETLRALDEVKAAIGTGTEEHGRTEDLSLKAISEERSEIVRLVRSTLRDALMIGASDVHLESVPGGLVIKFRIDGILSQVKFIQDPAQAEETIARVKVLAELDVTERRVPQDGRFKALERGRAVDFRVSIMPSIHGEDAVLRVLDKQALYESNQQKLSLSSLGFDAQDVAALRRLSREPYGMLLVTGPTGSGKTTTLYAAISEIHTGQDKIVTIEDPVEYQLAGVLQIPVNEKKGLGFARGLRSILRHDPDKIMVGEIRDPETANIAVQSALTGHLVFTTVHANNVFDVIGRFMHMNVDLHSFVSALNAILAQRLVRVICAECKSKGCRECRGSGFKGRKAIAELLILNDELREMIIARAPIRQLKDAAKRNGTRTLREAALDAVRKGETTLEEVDRVTFVD